MIPEDRRLDPTSPDINYSRPLDPAKIPAILDGSYVPDTDDQLAARSFENLVRYDEGHKTAYKGVTPIARPPLLSGWERVGAAILAQLQGPRLVVYSHPENDSPRGASGTSVIGVHEEEAERVQFIAAHEFWHDLWDNDRRLANLIGGIIEKHTDRLSFELAARGYSRSYKPHHRAEQEVAANLFASAVIDPGFWRTGNPLIAGALRALHANRAHPDARLVRDWDAFVRDVAGITIPSRQSGSFRHSRPLSQGAPGPVAEVFGQAGTAPVEPSSRERVLPVIKAKFFNADDPVSEGQTYQVERFMDAFMDPARGRDLVVTLQNSVSEQDRQIVTGMFQRELYEYAVKLMGATGDSSLYDYMQRLATTDFVSTADGMTMREIAQAMHGRAVPVSAAESARHIIKIDMVTNAGGRRGEAIGREGVEEIARAVDAEKLDQAEVEAVGDAVLPGTAQTLGEKVTALTPRGKRPSDPEANAREEAGIEGEGEVEQPTRRGTRREKTVA